MIEITVRDTEEKYSENVTGNLVFFAALSEEGAKGTIKGRGTNADFTVLYSLLKDVVKSIERQYPIVKILECLDDQETTTVDLQAIKDLLEKGGEK